MNGVTRSKVIEICKDVGIPVFEKNFSLLETYAAEEAFLTGTFGGITHVSSIDGHKIGHGEEGEFVSRLRNHYEAMIGKS